MTKPSQKMLAIAAVALAASTEANQQERYFAGLTHGCLAWGIAQLAGLVASLGK